MIVTVGSHKFHITWQYFGDQDRKLGLTYCIVSKLHDDNTRSEFIRGEARCSIKDNFSKNTGRKLSLERALLTKVPNPLGTDEWISVFVKEDRKRIWETYFKMRGDKY